MKKSTFDNRPELVENEGNVVRINFGVESEIQQVSSMDGEETEEREVWKAYVVRVEKPLLVEGIKAKLIGEGFGEYDAESIACEVMLKMVESGDATGDALTLAKQMVVARINANDVSEVVNSFTFGGQTMWLARDLRNELTERLKRAKAKGAEVLPIDYDGVLIPVPVDDAEVMLESLKNYADECYDKTQEHKRNVLAMESVEDVIDYDITAGYPEKLNF